MRKLLETTVLKCLVLILKSPETMMIKCLISIVKHSKVVILSWHWLCKLV